MTGLPFTLGTAILPCANTGGDVSESGGQWLAGFAGGGAGSTSGSIQRPASGSALALAPVVALALAVAPVFAVTLGLAVTAVLGVVTGSSLTGGLAVAAFAGLGLGRGSSTR
jgi:hypothetical protein